MERGRDGAGDAASSMFPFTGFGSGWNLPWLRGMMPAPRSGEEQGAGVDELRKLAD